MFLLCVLQIKFKDFSASFLFSRNAFSSFRSRKTTGIPARKPSPPSEMWVDANSSFFSSAPVETCP